MPNRCPKCGGICNHLVTDIAGKSHYRCNTLLTAFEVIGGILTKVPHLTPCNTVVCDGKEFKGYIAYITGGSVETLPIK